MPLQTGINLRDNEHHVASVPVDQVPAIGLQLVADVVDKSFRAVQVDRFVAANEKPQQPIEADKMIDVRVGDEDMLEAQNFARTQGVDIAEVDQHGSPREQE